LSAKKGLLGLLDYQDCSLGLCFLRLSLCGIKDLIGHQGLRVFLLWVANRCKGPATIFQLNILFELS
jgi:hypothetical protein